MLSENKKNAILTEKCHEYYRNNGKKIHDLVDHFVSKFGGLYQKDYDDFYSLANITFTEILQTYDFDRDFDGYLYVCLSNRIKSEMTKRNCQKRTADQKTVPLESPIGGNSDLTLIDVLTNDENLEEIILSPSIMEPILIEYLDSLSCRQRTILMMIVDDYKPLEIQDKLHINKKQYANDIQELRSYQKVKQLLKFYKSQL